MENLRGLLHLIIEKTRDVESDLEREYRELGERLLREGLGGVSSADLKEKLERAKETAELIDVGETGRDRIRKLMDQLSQLREAIEEKEGELTILREEIEPHYEKVGRAAAEALIDDEPEAAPYKKLLDPLRDIGAEIKQLNREISRAGQRDEEMSLVNQAIVGGKKLYQQGVLRTKQLRASNLYRRLGREICDSDLMTRYESRAFVDVFEPVLKNREQTKKIDTQIAALRNKAERLEGELDSLCENERPQRRLHRLEEERTKAMEVFEVQLRDLGGSYADHPGSASSLPKTVKAGLESVKVTRKELGSLGKRKDRVEAAIALEEIDRRVDSDRSKVRNLESTVKKANKEIASLSDEIKDLNEEREKLLKVRGSTEDLQLEPVGEE